MKLPLLLLAVILTYTSFAQITVSETEPDATADFNKVLYVGIPNPVRINIGKLKSAKVSVRNGTIEKTDIPGKFLITPTGSPATVIITANNYKKEIEFNVWALRDPDIEVAGPRNEDNMIWNFKLTSGIVARNKPLDIGIKYIIDSFAVILEDSFGKKTTHINIGNLWDSVTRKMIKEATSESTILITDVYITAPDRRRKLDTYLRYFFR